MPIQDENDTLRHFMWGVGRAYKEMAHFSKMPAITAGPAQRARPYTAGYLQGPTSAAARCLPFLRPPELGLDDEPPPMELARVDIEPLTAADASLDVRSQYHVLPRPLVDVILSVSRNGWREGWRWGATRRAWAEHRLLQAAQAIEWRHFRDAAIAAAEVWGTLLPGYLLYGLTGDERSQFDRAWIVLREMVDIKLFMGLLAEQLHVSLKEGQEEDITAMRMDVRRRKLIFDDLIGPQELQLAEQIEAAEAAVAESLRRMDEDGLPTGSSTFDVECLSIGPRARLRVRLAGNVHEFHPLPGQGGRCRYVVWVLDRADGRVKLLRLKSHMADQLRAMVAGAAALHDIIIKGHPADFNANILSRVELQWCEEAAMLTAEETAKIEQEARRERIEGYYNGRVAMLERHQYLVESRDKLVREMERLNAAQAAAGHRKGMYGYAERIGI